MIRAYIRSYLKHIVTVFVIVKRHPYGEPGGKKRGESLVIIHICYFLYLCLMLQPKKTSLLLLEPLCKPMTVSLSLCVVL